MDLAAEGEADGPGLLVADAGVEQLRLAGRDDVDRFEDDRTFDAAAGDGALEGAGLVDDELAADGAGRRAPGGDDCGERHTLAGAAPRGGLLQALAIPRPDGSIRRHSPITFKSHERGVGTL